MNIIREDGIEQLFLFYSAVAFSKYKQDISAGVKSAPIEIF